MRRRRIAASRVQAKWSERSSGGIHILYGYQQVLTRDEEALRFDILPSAGALLVLFLILGPIMLLGCGALLTSKDPLYGFALASVSAYFFLSVATVRVRVNTARELVLLRFWRVSWSAPLNSLNISDGGAKNMSAVPALIIRDRVTGCRVGELIRDQFRNGDLQRLRVLLSAPGKH